MSYKNQTDEALMLHVQNGDEKAFTELYSRYCNAIYRFFLRLYFFDEAKSRDATQDLFIKVLEKPHHFDVNRKFSSWLYAVATNLFRNSIRNEKRRKEIVEQHLDADCVLWPEVAENMDRALFLRCFRERFNKLNAEQKLLLTLRFENEKTIGEIAAILDIAEGTVKSRLFYLLKGLGEGLR